MVTLDLSSVMRAAISLPRTGDRPGRKGVVTVMVSWALAGAVDLDLRSKILRHFKSLDHAHHAKIATPMNDCG